MKTEISREVAKRVKYLRAKSIYHKITRNAADYFLKSTRRVEIDKSGF